MSRNLIMAALFAWAGTAQAAPDNYLIENSHSFANWQIRHVVAKVSGTFYNVSGKITVDRDDLAASSVQAKINMFSLSSNHQERDVHTLTEDYLDAHNFKEMSFVSTGVKPDGPDGGTLSGKFTLHGITKDIEFPFKLLGFGKDPWGGSRMGVEAHTRIKASDYGYEWMKKPGAAVGDDIDITLLIEGVKVGFDGKPVVEKK